MEFEKIHLGDVATLKNGYAYKSKDFVENGIPVVKIKNIQPPFIDINDCNYVSEDVYELTKEYSLRYGDILISMTGSGVNQMSSAVGKVGRVQFNYKALQNQRVGKIEIIDKTKYDSDFLFYYISQKKLLEYFVINSTGSANQANISKKIIENTPIPNISLYKQKKIGYILKLLDKKIKKNNKIIENLEAQAQAIFKSWFVDFEPFQDGNFVESELGLIPESWEIKTIDEICNLKIGRTPPRKESKWFSLKDGLKWISIKDLGNSEMYIYETSEYLTKEAVEKFNVSVVSKNTLLLSFKLTVGRVAITSENMCTNEAIAQFVDSEIDPVYLYLYFKQFPFETLGNTSSIGKAINSKIIKNISIPIPNSKILREFMNIINPLANLINSKISENQTLAQTRDTILPKLMSGEIDVSNIKIDDEDTDYE